MKVLWVTQTVPVEADAKIGGQKEINKTGGWIQGMAGELMKHKDISLAFISTSSLVKTYTKVQVADCTYHVLPNSADKDTSAALCRQINEDYKPDVVHIHGTEYPFALIWVNACGNGNIVVSLQGIMQACCKYYYSGMSQWDVIRHITPRDMVRGTIFKKARKFGDIAKLEKELIASVNHVIGRTDWDRKQLWSMNPEANYHFNNEILRSDFYTAEKWSYDRCEPHTIFVNQAAVPYKGLHQLVKALPLIRAHYPNVKVKVAGFNICDQSLFRRLARTGYGAYLLDLMKTYKVEDCINFTGPLNAENMKTQMLKANVFLLPSSIDNSPNALGEAQILGVPCVASRVGGVASMIPGKECGSMYRFSDTEELAYAICRVFAEAVSFDNTAMIKEAARRHDRQTNAHGLISIYESVLHE